METLRQEFQDALDQKQIEPGLLNATAGSWPKYQIVRYDPIASLSIYRLTMSRDWQVTRAFRRIKKPPTNAQIPAIDAYSSGSGMG